MIELFNINVSIYYRWLFHEVNIKKLANYDVPVSMSLQRLWNDYKGLKGLAEALHTDIKVSLPHL